MSKAQRTSPHHVYKSVIRKILFRDSPRKRITEIRDLLGTQSIENSISLHFEFPLNVITGHDHHFRLPVLPGGLGVGRK